MKKKVIIVSIVALIMLALLIPIPRYLNDGGTVEYKALLYNVTKLNKLNYHSSTGYDRGTKIEILGIEVYNDIVVAEPTIINNDENYQKYSKIVDNLCIELNIPSKWKYKELPKDLDNDFYKFALKLYKNNEEQYAVLYFYNNPFGVCVGDNVLATFNIPTWSNSANASGTHYTIFYSFIFLIPALVLAIKYKNDLFSKTGKWLSIFFIGLLILGIIFSANVEEIERKKAKEDMEKTEQELEELVENMNNKETEELSDIYESANNEETSGVPNIYVSSNDKEIMSRSGSAYWLETIYDAIDPRDGNHRDSFTINSQETINIKTDYKVSNVEIQSINKDNNERYTVQYDTKTKKISFKNIEDGTYIITYKIENNNDYVYYSFKVIIHN